MKSKVQAQYEGNILQNRPFFLEQNLFLLWLKFYQVPYVEKTPFKWVFILIPIMKKFLRIQKSQREKNLKYFEILSIFKKSYLIFEFLFKLGENSPFEKSSPN